MSAMTTISDAKLYKRDPALPGVDVPATDADIVAVLFESNRLFSQNTLERRSAREDACGRAWRAFTTLNPRMGELRDADAFVAGFYAALDRLESKEET